MYNLIIFLLTTYNGGVIDNQTSPTPQKPDNEYKTTIELKISPVALIFIIIAVIFVISILVYIFHEFKKGDKDDNNDNTKKLG